MKSNSLGRVIKFGATGFWRNIWLSVATIIIITLCLLIFSSLVILNTLTNTAIKSAQDKVDISVYFKTLVQEPQIQSIVYDLEELPETKSVQYISRKQALENFTELHKDNPVILESLEELQENPLRATINIKANDPVEYPSLVSFLGQEKYQPFIEKINYNDNKPVIDKLISISNTVKKVGLGVSAVFLIISLIMVFNTVRLTIYSRREEIEIMKLVGATNWYTRWPFLIEGILYGFFASVASLLILYPILRQISPRITSFFGGYGQDLLAYFVSHLWMIIALNMIVAIFLGAISSLIAIRRYLKV